MGPEDFYAAEALRAPGTRTAGSPASTERRDADGIARDILRGMTPTMGEAQTLARQYLRAQGASA